MTPTSTCSSRRRSSPSNPPRAETIAAACYAYRKVLRTRQGDKDLCDRLCRLYSYMGNYPDLLYVARQRLSTAPDDADAALWLGRGLEAQHKMDDLETELTRFIEEKDPHAVPAYVLLCEAYVQSGDTGLQERAIPLMNKAVERNPKSAAARAMRAMCLIAVPSNDAQAPRKSADGPGCGRRASS